MKKIKLSQGRVALVDDEDYEWLNQFTWFTTRSRDAFYASRRERGVKNKKVKMHRMIMKTPVHLQVDHIDHNGLNNQKSNLRNCTNSQNHMNEKPKRNAKYKGVQHCVKKYKNSVYKSIQSKIYVNGKSITLGTFKTERDAAIAYNNAAAEYFGDFANLNIIE